MHLDPHNEKKTRVLSRIKKENSIMEERVSRTRTIPGPYNEAQLRSNWVPKIDADIIEVGIRSYMWSCFALNKFYC